MLPHPTYYFLGDHTESIQVEYDPTRTSYEDLLKVFWSSHNPCAAADSRQYMSAVFYHNENQRQRALATRERAAERLHQPLTTPVLPLTAFYPAEDYHQKWFLRQHGDFLREFQ